MKILGNFCSGDEKTGNREKDGKHLAFILLTEPRLPDPLEVAKAFRKFAINNESITAVAEDNIKSFPPRSASLIFNTSEVAAYGLVTSAIPDSVADKAAKYSLTSLTENWKLPQHSAHLIVNYNARKNISRREQLSKFTSLLAALNISSKSVGVYWKSSGATHDSDFFNDVSIEKSITSRLMLWTGISVGREDDGRLNLLSLGMNQLNLPDLLLVVGPSSESSAIGTMFDFLNFAIENGEPLTDGETIGRHEAEALQVNYVTSPINKDQSVWRVELP